MEDLLNKRYFQILSIGFIAVISLILVFIIIITLHPNQSNTPVIQNTQKALDDYDSLDENIINTDSDTLSSDDLSDYSLGISDTPTTSNQSDTNDVESFLNNVTDLSTTDDVNF